jgi:hypothetical protein
LSVATGIDDFIIHQAVGIVIAHGKQRELAVDWGWPT